jgi:hypothetical protein
VATRNQIVAKTLIIFGEQTLKCNDQHPYMGMLKIAMVIKSNLIPTIDVIKLSHGASLVKFL